jgi:hypothetical protein
MTLDPDLQTKTFDPDTPDPADAVTQPLIDGFRGSPLDNCGWLIDTVDEVHVVVLPTSLIA